MGTFGNYSGTWSRRVAAGAAVGFGLAIGHVGSAAAQSQSCTPPASPPMMTIQIYNNSPDHNIYPVLSAGSKKGVDEWLQAIFCVTQSTAPSHKYPQASQYRFYINPKGVGIPPKGMVTINLPLYTQLVQTVSPNLEGQYIDWWQGGRIEIFEANLSTAAPPAALTYLLGQEQTPVTPVKFAPTCTGLICQPLTLYSASIGLPSGAPSQLLEYTLGAKNAPPPCQSPADCLLLSLDTKNLDIDVSYVDATYLPAAMEPFGNPGNQTGYVGTLQAIDAFRNAMQTWRQQSNYTGWPLLSFQGQVDATKPKIPSAIHIFGRDPNGLANPPFGYPADLYPLPTKDNPNPWPPITKMQQNWTTCINAPTTQYCQWMVDVKTLFEANYREYVKLYKDPTFACNTDMMHPNPVALNDVTVLRNVYGWSPFNDYCKNPEYNLLQNTPGYYMGDPPNRTYPGYQAVKNEFDDLQIAGYPPAPPLPRNLSPEFDPYTTLIHGANYLNIPNAYAYSVDDAVGNLQAYGTGMVIVVGGSYGLPNVYPATLPVQFGFGPKTCAVPLNMDGSCPNNNFITMTRYGVCTSDPTKGPNTFPVNLIYTSFIVGGSQDPASPKNCPLSLQDSTGRIYRLTITQKPEYTPLIPVGGKPPGPDTGNHAVIDCSANNNDAVALRWCKTVFAYTQQGFGGKGAQDTPYVIAPAPFAN